MHRALQIARLGLERVAPNPLVGCVILHPENGLIGEGWHRCFGMAHAEVNAIQSVKKPDLLPDSFLFVTLEPCSHFGKTPPCSNLIIQTRFASVFICNVDPNPLVNGKGINAIASAGIPVEFGILESEGLELNRVFFTAQRKKRPFITLKWAQTADGFIGKNEGKPLVISSAESHLLVHKMRACHQAIFAGRNTLRKDNPMLNLRSWPGRQPVRVISDPASGLSKELNVFTDQSSPTWILNPEKEETLGNHRYLVCPDPDSPEEMSNLLFRNGIHSLLVEGGNQVLHKFIQAGLWDEIIVFTSPLILGEGIPAPALPLVQPHEMKRIGPDYMRIYRR